MDDLMQNDRRLAPRLGLATELEAFDRFMREHNLAPTRIGSAGLPEILDNGADVARRMRAIAMNRWTWYGWKRGALRPLAELQESVTNRKLMMKSTRFSAFLVILLCSIEAIAQTPIYAVYGIEVTNERGTFKTVNVGLLPSGTTSACRNQIDVYERAVLRTSSRMKLIRSECIFTLPVDLQPMVRDERLPDAYVLKQSGNWAPLYSAWYGLPNRKPNEICAQLIAGMRKKLTAEQADVKCLPPLGFARIR